MTAYGAVNSLRNTIDYILHSSHFSLVDPSPRILQLAYGELNPLQDILKKLDSTRTSKSRKKVNALDGRIKELIWEFEDLMESLLYQQIVSQVEDEGMKERVWEFHGLLESLPSQPQIGGERMRFSIDQHHVPATESLLSHPQPQPQFIFQSPPPHHKTTTSRRRKLVVHKHKGRKFNTPRIMNESEASHSRSLEDDVGGKRFTIDLHCLEDDVCSLMERLKDMEEEYIYEVGNMPEDDEDQSIVSSRSGTKSKMIGLSDQFQKLKRNLLQSYDMKNYTALVGTAGVGKTALAEAIFEDPDIVSLFEHRAWVTVGRKSQFDDVSRGITQGDDELGAYLEERLKGKKCLIVLDDVWETQILDCLTSSLQNIFDRSIQILVTTRNRSITFSMIYPTSTIVVRFLNEEESKELLCEKVFGEKDCPFQLDKAAIKIAKNCEGLPLMIVTVADILSKTRNTDKHGFRTSISHELLSFSPLN